MFRSMERCRIYDAKSAACVMDTFPNPCVFETSARYAAWSGLLVLAVMFMLSEPLLKIYETKSRAYDGEETVSLRGDVEADRVRSVGALNGNSGAEERGQAGLVV
ncbi:hypothetical protein K432DRAFT_460417 [Lepidopterella palustris CBS 459.81]|uniref:Uncharacterized protein n=1 Tax=Lepidopterella palustris CBS 459.81 TaxID=1314670 RepID=A0A8E2E548_9PEZI|nr:hypothetical protein K432DRAFT_460417 [Lepidopterella palustris CBS 459.81]